MKVMQDEINGQDYMTNMKFRKLCKDDTYDDHGLKVVIFPDNR